MSTVMSIGRCEIRPRRTRLLATCTCRTVAYRDFGGRWSFRGPTCGLSDQTPDTHKRGRQTKSHDILKKVFEINSVTHPAGCRNRYTRFDKPDWVPPRSVELLHQVRERVRYLHCSLQTEKAYVYWAKSFVLWAARSSGGFRHPCEMRQTEGEGLQQVGNSPVTQPLRTTQVNDKSDQKVLLPLYPKARAAINSDKSPQPAI